MVTRRAAIVGSVGSVLTSHWVAAALPAKPAPASELLFALAGKKPLIKRTYRPPNFETPFADLRRPFTENEAFFVRYHLPVIPEIDARTWTLRIGGPSVERAMELSREALEREFERVEVAAVNQCSGNRRGLFTPRVPGVQWKSGAMGNAVWAGVRLRDVLAKAGLRNDALEIVFDAADAGVLPPTPRFSKSLPVERALDESTLIALRMNGKPLPHWHGAPARLVVPGWTATYWVKHLTEVRAVPAAFDGFWMKTGYRVPTGAFPGARFRSQETAENTPVTEILVNSLVTSHVSGQHIARSRPQQLEGWAWDGGTGIGAVEVSLDEGASWREAKLGKDLGRFAWRAFAFALDTRRAGPLSISVRAVSRGGARQPVQLTPNPSGYHHNRVQSLALEVV